LVQSNLDLRKDYDVSSENGDKDHYDDNSDRRPHQKWRIKALENCVNNTLVFIDIRVILGHAAENVQAIILKNICFKNGTASRSQIKPPSSFETRLKY